MTSFFYLNYSNSGMLEKYHYTVKWRRQATTINYFASSKYK